MTVDRFNPAREEFLEAVVLEHDREECPAGCGFYGQMGVEPVRHGAEVYCPECGASYLVEPRERPVGLPRSAVR